MLLPVTPLRLRPRSASCVLLGNLSVDVLQDEHERVAMGARDLFHRRAVEDEAITQDGEDAGTVHGDEARRMVPGALEEARPSVKADARAATGHGRGHCRPCCRVAAQ